MKIEVSIKVPWWKVFIVKLFGKRCPSAYAEMYEFRGRYYILSEL